MNHLICVWSYYLVMAKKICEKMRSFMRTWRVRTDSFVLYLYSKSQTPVPLTLPRPSPYIGIVKLRGTMVSYVMQNSPPPQNTYASSPWTASSPMSKSSSDICNCMKIRIHMVHAMLTSGVADYMPFSWPHKLLPRFQIVDSRAQKLFVRTRMKCSCATKDP